MSADAQRVLPVVPLMLLLMWMIVISFLGGWALGLLQGYRWGSEGPLVAAEVLPPSDADSWLDHFRLLDDMAAQVNPDLPTWERRWWVQLILEAAYRWRVDPVLAMSVAITESGFRQEVVSRRGAIGIMQLMPITAQHFGIDPYDLEQNIDTGVRYLGDLLRRYGGNLSLALAAYNAGPSQVRNSVPAIRETRNYVRKVQRIYTASASGGRIR